MYREYRDLTQALAVTQCYRDMGAKHQARPSTNQIMKIKRLPAKECRRPYVAQFHDSKIRYVVNFQRVLYSRNFVLIL